MGHRHAENPFRAAAAEQRLAGLSPPGSARAGRVRACMRRNGFPHARKGALTADTAIAGSHSWNLPRGVWSTEDRSASAAVTVVCGIRPQLPPGVWATRGGDLSPTHWTPRVKVEPVPAPLDGDARRDDRSGVAELVTRILPCVLPLGGLRGRSDGHRLPKSRSSSRAYPVYRVLGGFDECPAGPRSVVIRSPPQHGSGHAWIRWGSQCALPRSGCQEGGSRIPATRGETTHQFRRGRLN